MDWQSFNQDYVLIAIASGSFMAGVVFTRLALRSGKRAAASEDRRDHLIRQLEADLRLAKRQLEEYAVQVETKTQECDQSTATAPYGMGSVSLAVPTPYRYAGGFNAINSSLARGCLLFTACSVCSSAAHAVFL